MTCLTFTSFTLKFLFFNILKNYTIKCHNYTITVTPAQWNLKHVKYNTVVTALKPPAYIVQVPLMLSKQLDMDRGPQVVL